MPEVADRQRVININLIIRLVLVVTIIKIIAMGNQIDSIIHGVLSLFKLLFGTLDVEDAQRHNKALKRADTCDIKTTIVLLEQYYYRSY